MEDSTSGERAVLAVVVEHDGQEEVLENLAVVSLGSSRYEVLLSPGLVQGVAAGDVVEYDSASRMVRTVKRGGNVCLQIFHPGIPESEITGMKSRILRLGGVIDGEASHLLVATVPVTVGFPAIEEMAEGFERIDGVEWMFGNVYDQEGNPLNWWA